MLLTFTAALLGSLVVFIFLEYIKPIFDRKRDRRAQKARVAAAIARNRASGRPLASQAVRGR